MLHYLSDFSSLNSMSVDAYFSFNVGFWFCFVFTNLSLNSLSDLHNLEILCDSLFKVATVFNGSLLGPMYCRVLIV